MGKRTKWLGRRGRMVALQGANKGELVQVLGEQLTREGLPRIELMIAGPGGIRTGRPVVFYNKSHKK